MKVSDMLLSSTSITRKSRSVAIISSLHHSTISFNAISCIVLPLLFLQNSTLDYATTLTGLAATPNSFMQNPTPTDRSLEINLHPKPMTEKPKPIPPWRCIFCKEWFSGQTDYFAHDLGPEIVITKKRCKDCRFYGGLKPATPRKSGKGTKKRVKQGVEDKDLTDVVVSRKEESQMVQGGGQQTMDEGYISGEGVAESKDGGKG